jgi:hypothetical protein
VWLQPDLASDTSGGRTVTWLGDIDGDNRADLLVGTPTSTVAGLQGAEVVDAHQARSLVGTYSAPLSR